MKVRKAIKAIAALGAGISMVGATIMGAMAADLSAYQAPFVQNGGFNGLIVVGDQAAAEDIVGAIDIGISLQYGVRQEAAFGSGAAAVTISEGKKIDKTGDHLNYGDNLSDIISVLDEEDLPVILADGRYQDSEGETTNDETYTQTLRLYDDGGKMVFAKDDDGDKVADSYLFFDDGSGDYAYNFTLEFDNSVDYTKTAADTPAEDLEDTLLKIQGNDYTITDIKYDANYYLTKVTLLAGETIIWLQQGKTLTRTIAGVEHEVEVTDVNDNEDMCGVSIDGDVVWIKKGQTQTINGVAVGVTDAVAVHAQLQDVDICKINIGATEIVLENGQEVEVNGGDIDGSDVRIMNSSSDGGWDGFEITWIPGDEEYLAEGASLQDPVFGNFEFKFAGISKVTEEITLTSSSGDAEFVFMNNDGREVEIPYYDAGGIVNIIMGDDFDATNCDGRLLIEGETCDSTGVDKGSIEGVKFLLVTSGKEAHVMQVANIDSNNKTDFKDLTYGKTFSDKDMTAGSNYGSGTNWPVDFGSLGTVTLNFNFLGGNFTAVDTNLAPSHIIETKYGAVLGFRSTHNATDAGPGLTNGSIIFQEENSENNEMNVTLNLTYYATDDEIRITTPTLTANGANAWYTSEDVAASKSDKDTKFYVTEWGTMIEFDSDGKNDLTLWYPDEQVVGNAFIAPVGAVLSGSGGETSAVTLNPINVGAAKLASEVAGSEKTQNMIVVGGPCANDAAKVIMGLEDGADCTAGFEPGKAMIKLYQNGDNVAMVVAGYSAEDTRRATTVVAKYKDYADKLTGMEVSVEGSMANIQVLSPSS